MESPTGQDALQARLSELECRFSFQEQMLQTLSDELARQQQLTEQLQASLQLVYRQMKDWQEARPDGGLDLLADEKPPHY